MSLSGGFQSSLRLKPRRWCVFISGRGSNLAAAIESVQLTNSNRIELVVATAENLPGTAKARRAGIPVLVLPKFKNENGKQEINWDHLQSELKRRRIDFIFLLGFMRIVPSRFIGLWKNRILNLHPSLLPSYPGLKSIERAYIASDKLGASVHIVVPEVDAGKVLKMRMTAPPQKASFSLAEFCVHRDEQRLVCEFVQQANSDWESSKETRV